MKAVCWQGKGVVTVERVPDPGLINPHDAIIEVSSTAICGSDLHIYAGAIPAMLKGDILGHEFMGTVVEVGGGIRKLRVGDRVVIPFNIACGRCLPCRRGDAALCDNTNPNAWLAERLYGHSGCGLFGYSHIYGGYAGGQAEYVRVPFADFGALVIPDEVADERVLFLSDVLPTGYMAADNCGIRPGETVAVWGLGPVGQFAVRSALLLGAGRVIAIDDVEERLALAACDERVFLLDRSRHNVAEALRELTAGMGPDACIDAVGMEAHGHSLDALYDRARHALRLQTDRLNVLREAVQSCRKGGTVSVPGVYGGWLDKFNFGAAFAKGLELRMGQTHVHRYMPPLLDLILRDKLDPSDIISHRFALQDAPAAYRMFRDKLDGCTKVVLKPRMRPAA